MTTIAFDAIAYSKAMHTGGFTREQADAFAEGQQKAIREILDANELVTKADLNLAIAQLETKMAALHSSTIKWVVGATISLGAFLSAIIFGSFAIIPVLGKFIQ